MSEPNGGHKTRYSYECADCKAKVPVTDVDPDPVIMVPGDRKFEWVFLCRGCAPKCTQS
jgi:hypothetical protein